MKKKLFLFCLLSIFASYGCRDDCENCITSPGSPASNEYQILINGQIVPETGYSIGINDAKELCDWMSTDAGSLKMRYPRGLDWAAAFITVGETPFAPSKSCEDFSQYTKVAIEMKGDVGGECVQVGMKDGKDPDDGSETKRSVRLSPNWEIYEFDLSDFRTCDLSQVYVVTEFVFPCSSYRYRSQTVEVRNITFLKEGTLVPPPEIPDDTDDSCDGVRVDGYCWYLGASGDSCDRVCASHGGYHEATRTYAGSSGSINNCDYLLSVLGAPTASILDISMEGLGCYYSYATNYRWWDTEQTLSSASSSSRARVCACQK